MSDEREDRDDRPVKREIKVTDKRMFTPDGELREEYRGLAGEEAGAAGSAPPDAATPAPPDRPGQAAATAPPETPAAAPTGGAAPPGTPAAGAAGGEERPPLELPPGPGPQPTFLDLLGILAEPATIYLGDVELPDGRTAENLDAARLHIDLLDVLRRKTAGNLTAQEAAVLEDVLYRLRMRYVQKRG